MCLGFFVLYMRFSFSLAFLVICGNESVGMLAASKRTRDDDEVFGDDEAEVSPDAPPTVRKKGRPGDGTNAAATHEGAGFLVSTIGGAYDHAAAPSGKNAGDQGTPESGQYGENLADHKIVVDGVHGSLDRSSLPGLDLKVSQTAPSTLLGGGATGISDGRGNGAETSTSSDRQLEARDYTQKPPSIAGRVGVSTRESEHHDDEGGSSFPTSLHETPAFVAGLQLGASGTTEGAAGIVGHSDKVGGGLPPGRGNLPGEREELKTTKDLAASQHGVGSTGSVSIPVSLPSDVSSGYIVKPGFSSQPPSVKSTTTAIGVPIVTATFQTSSIATQEKLFFANFHNAAQQLSLLGIKAVGLATQIQAIRGHMMMLKLIDEHIITLTADEKEFTDLLQKAHIELRKVVEITPAVGAPEDKP